MIDSDSSVAPTLLWPEAKAASPKAELQEV
jgi:hypothetical protein